MTSLDTGDVTDIQCPRDEDEADVETGVFRSRWYVLLILSLSTTLQHAVWATWGPIAQSAKAVYGWDNSTIAIIINCGNVGVLLFLVASGYCVSRNGLRVSMLTCTFLLSLGPGMRLISTQPFLATILIGAGQFFNGVAGSLTAVMPPVMSETWFPSNERTTATAIGVLSNTLGGAAAFLLECGWGVLLLILTLIYYPARPPRPPSTSASQTRFQFREGFGKLSKKASVWQITIICALPWAVFGNWLGLLDVNLHQVGITQITAGWFGFYACLSGSLGGVVIGALTDKCQRQMKTLLLLLFTASFFTSLWITGMRDGYLHSSQGMFAVAIALLGVLENGATPLCYETACELAYPVPEEMVGTFIGLVINCAAVIFLLIQVIPYVGTSWMNWALVGVFGANIPLLLSFKARYNRMDVDSETSPLLPEV